MKVLYLRSNETKNSGKEPNTIGANQLKGTRKWIVWKENVKMLKRNLIIWSKYRWNIEKWIFGKLMILK